ncbi:hypothetical protein [Nannocystis sp.]|uniref:hypothetical protein n=1 Tax=Nannocystis sp. TaxID=1962667 RepID=UPI002429E726|nr:hypothetical protein [Nannocystis sp.]MBK7824708.1 hypothetical protein [Nannocystis sp.]MBK9753042.1 hypothetical protein [Nannocystis sp.]
MRRLTPPPPTARPRAWLRSPTWDLTLLAFCWLPFYVWAVFGLGLDGSWAAGVGSRDALAWATLVALAITYVHRHYTFLLVYGDGETFRRRAREFVLAPLLVFAVVGLCRGTGGMVWKLLLVAVGAWNVWHTLMQRFGILRIYAGKAGCGLQEPAHGRRDLALLWCSVIFVSWITLLLRAETFAGQANARLLLRVVRPLISGTGAWAVLAVLAAGWLAVLLYWLRHEMRAALCLRERLPRWTFLASTLLLLAVFVVHGPIVGYLCFGVAHALEYVAFVHHFGQQKFAQDGATGFTASLLRRPLWAAPLLIGVLLTAFILLRDHRGADLYLVYYLGTSLLHFLFDGWIWKVRRPEVRRPLGVA